MCLHFQVRKAYRVTTLSSRKRVNRGCGVISTILWLHIFRSIFVPQTKSLGFVPPQPSGIQKKSACKYTARNVTRAAAIQLE